MNEIAREQLRDDLNEMDEGSLYDYYRARFKLIREMLGTCSEASIWTVHVLQKAKKEIKRANSMVKKLTKVSDKYVGREIPESKEIDELKGIIRVYEGLLGKKIKLPDTAEELLELGKEIASEYEKIVEGGELQKPTIFMRGSDGMPVLSTHMILGNLKENMRILTSYTTKDDASKVLKYKNSVGSIFALDVKAVEEFMYPDQDIMRLENGERDLLERPIRFEQMGKETTAISRSERLPEGTEFDAVLRVRSDSPITEKVLRMLLGYGKNNGLGAWRGSGNRGAYVFKLDRLENYTERVTDGWS